MRTRRRRPTESIRSCDFAWGGGKIALDQHTGPFVLVHGPITLLDVETDDAANFHKWQNAPAHQIGDRSKVATIMICNFLLKSPWTRWLRSCDLRLMVIHELLFGGDWAEPGFTRDRRQDSPKQRNGLAPPIHARCRECSNQVTVKRAPARHRTRLDEWKQLGVLRQKGRSKHPETERNREKSVTTPVTTRGRVGMGCLRKSLIMWRIRQDLNLQPSDPKSARQL